MKHLSSASLTRDNDTDSCTIHHGQSEIVPLKDNKQDTTSKTQPFYEWGNWMICSKDEQVTVTRASSSLLHLNVIYGCNANNHPISSSECGLNQTLQEIRTSTSVLLEQVKRREERREEKRSSLHCPFCLLSLLLLLLLKNLINDSPRVYSNNKGVCDHTIYFFLHHET